MTCHADECAFDTIRPLWHEGRLIAYDIFRGLHGKVWMLSPLYATAWQNWGGRKPTFLVETPPLGLAGGLGEPGLLSGLFIDQHYPHLFYGQTHVHPRTWWFHLHAILYEFDVTLPDGNSFDLYYTIDGHQHTLPVYLPAPNRPNQYSCATTTMYRDDNEIIPEWLQHSRSVGFQHFYLYDNFSEQKIDFSGRPYVSAFDWPYPYHYEMPAAADEAKKGWYGDGLVHGLGCQMPQQMHTLYKHGPECNWLAFFDDDEYLNLLSHTHLQDLLATDRKRTVVSFPSLRYGGRREEGATSIRERYLHREPPDEGSGFGYGRRKPIVNVSQVLPGEHVGVHDYVSARDPYDNMRRDAFATEMRRHVPVETARLNHYFDLSYQRRGQDLSNYFVEEFDDSINH